MPGLRPANGDEVAREIAELKLRLVRSPADVDLAAFLRELGSGTAVLPAAGQGRVSPPPPPESAMADRVGSAAEEIASAELEILPSVSVDPNAATRVPVAVREGGVAGPAASPSGTIAARPAVGAETAADSLAGDGEMIEQAGDGRVGGRPTRGRGRRRMPVVGIALVASAVLVAAGAWWGARFATPPVASAAAAVVPGNTSSAGLAHAPAGDDTTAVAIVDRERGGAAALDETREAGANGPGDAGGGGSVDGAGGTHAARPAEEGSATERPAGTVAAVAGWPSGQEPAGTRERRNLPAPRAVAPSVEPSAERAAERNRKRASALPIARGAAPIAQPRDAGPAGDLGRSEAPRDRGVAAPSAEPEAQRMLGGLTLSSRRPARAAIDGRQLGTLSAMPSPFAVPAGRQRVRFEALDGSSTCTVSVDVPARGKSALRFEAPGVVQPNGNDQLPLVCEN